jgi:hypothetical protein
MFKGLKSLFPATGHPTATTWKKITNEWLI